MARERQPRPQGSSNVYSEIDYGSRPYDDAVDPTAIELNPAYQPAETGPGLPTNLGTEAPFTHISLIEGAVIVETPIGGDGVEEVQRAESGVENEEADVTYYTPMDADVEDKEGVQSRAVLNEAEPTSRPEGEGDINLGAVARATTWGGQDEAFGSSGRECLVGGDGEIASDEEDNAYTAYI